MALSRNLAESAGFDDWFASLRKAQDSNARIVTYEEDQSQAAPSDKIPPTRFVSTLRDAVWSFACKLTPEPRFTLFSSLPVELRLEIWQAALPGPRFVELVAADHDPTVTYVDNTISSLLRTNMEARMETLRLFEPALRGWNAIIDVTDALLNFQVDTLLLPEDPHGVFREIRLHDFSNHVFAHLKYLAIDNDTMNELIGDYYDDQDEPERAIASLLGFRNLELITVVIKGPVHWVGDLTFSSPYGMIIEPLPPVYEPGVKFQVAIPERSPIDELEDALVDRVIYIEGEDRLEFLEEYLTEICDILRVCLEGDSTWKVPRVEFKVMKRGGTFSN